MFQVPKIYIRQKVAWKSWLNNEFYNFKNVKLDVKRGSIPGDINGTLFNNTNACQIREKEQLGHLYDGDGAILKVDIQDGGAKASLKFIETESYLKEEKANKFTEQGWGNVLPWHQTFMKQFKMKNTANASIFKFEKANNLLALGYHGLPYKVDMETLDTVGEENFGGRMNDDQTLGLNFKVLKGENSVYNFSYDMEKGKLYLYQYDMEGNIVNENKSLLKKPSLFIQDCCLAGDYLVFIVSGQFLGSLNFGRKSLWDKIEYEQSGGTYSMVFDRHTLELVSEEECDPLFVKQFGNGFQFKNGSLLVDAIIHPDKKNNQMLQQIINERIDISGYNGKLHRLEVDPRTGMIKKSVKRDVHPCEFPTFNKDYMGEFFSEIYFTVNGMRKEFDIGNTVAKLDRKNQINVYRDKAPDTFLRQPILSQNNKYLFSLGLNTESNENELHIINAEDMKQICVLSFSELVPFPTQGMWVDN